MGIRRVCNRVAGGRLQIERLETGDPHLSRRLLGCRDPHGCHHRPLGMVAALTPATEHLFRAPKEPS